jgi:cell division septal protein FtsQ
VVPTALTSLKQQHIYKASSSSRRRRRRRNCRPVRCHPVMVAMVLLLLLLLLWTVSQHLKGLSKGVY